METNQASGGTYRPTLNRETGAPDAPPLAELFNRFSYDLKELARSEATLAKREVEDKLTQVKQDAAGLALGGAAIVGGSLVLLAAAVLALALIMPAWLAAMLVGVVVTGAGVGLVLAAKAKLSRLRLTPDRTLASVGRDVEELKRAAT
jgi:hypothetical protein